MKSDENSPRREFIKKSLVTAATLTTSPGLIFGKSKNTNPINRESSQIRSGQNGLVRVAFIGTVFWMHGHQFDIATKFFTGIPTDDGMVKSNIKIVSMYIDQIQIGASESNVRFGTNDFGTRFAAINEITLYPTIADALTLGGDKLAVDGVIFIGEHGHYQFNRLGQELLPRMSSLEQIFRVFDASGKSVPLYTDKALSYSWLDSMWIYNRGKELNVPMMAGSSLPYCWRDPNLVHPIGAKITDAVAIGWASLDAYGFHVVEILQCMVERRAGGETGVSSVEGLLGNDVWAAIDSGKISQELVDAACGKIKDKPTGNMRDLVKKPAAVIVHYNDGTRGACLMLTEYVNKGWAYAAKVDGKTVAAEFIFGQFNRDRTTFIEAPFSYLDLNIQKLMVTGKPPVPIERNLLTSCVIDMAIRSVAEKKIKKTPFLNIVYNVEGYDPIRPTGTGPTGQSLGPWPPKGYEYLIPDWYKKK